MATIQVIKFWPPHGHWPGVLYISDLQLAALDLYPTVIYRPRTLVLGVGCRKGVACAEIESLYQQVCKEQRFAALSLGMVATASLKAQEPGLLEFASGHGVPLKSFSVEELSRVDGVPTPSARVKELIGVAGVAEPAALLAAGASMLVMPKCKGQRVTMALARRENV